MSVSVAVLDIAIGAVTREIFGLIAGNVTYSRTDVSKFAVPGVSFLAIQPDVGRIRGDFPLS